MDHANVVVCLRELSSEQLRPTVRRSVFNDRSLEVLQSFIQVFVRLQVQKPEVKISFDVFCVHL